MPIRGNCPRQSNTLFPRANGARACMGVSGFATGPGPAQRRRVAGLGGLIAQASIVVAVASIVTGCVTDQSPERLNAPPQGLSDRPNMLAPQFIYMADNAMLHDMSIADFHFVPHTSELSGTGVARLTRLSELLNIYGGTVRYETFEKDETLVNARLAHAREFIAGTGCDMDRVKVETLISGGRGLKATEAIRIMEEGTVNDMLETESGGSSSPEGATSAGGVGG